MELQQIYYQQRTVANHSVTTKSHLEPQTQQDESFWGDDGFTLADVIDMVNPMQHLPVISKYYRELTADDCSEGSRLVGDLGFGILFSGAMGAVSAVANSTIRHETHQDISEHLIELANESYHSLDSLSENLNTNKVNTEAMMQKITPPKESINPFFAQLINDVDDYSPTYGQLSGTKQAEQHREIINPFFAQLFDDNTNEYSSGKDWGSV
ncbi:MAG: hypothetical protein KZQ83_06205 [gamma proteobacterium symbiont of Taylorina sp.]|nr:hypothetical protein [gamma proteobacterium symbiont of Taylorina sp.]